jgi:hypothetical protein
MDSGYWVDGKNVGKDGEEEVKRRAKKGRRRKDR